MLLPHAEALAGARSYLAALAYNAHSFDSLLEYDRVLLELDTLYGDETPAVYPVAFTDRDVLCALAEAAIESLIDYGADSLSVELLLAHLDDAKKLDVH